MKRPETTQFGNNPAADIELLKRIRAQQDRQEATQGQTDMAKAVVVIGAVIFAMVGLVDLLWS